MDFRRFNMNHGHDMDEHVAAGNSPYMHVSALGTERFLNNVDAFFDFESDEDPNAANYMLHLLHSGAFMSIEQTLRKAHEDGVYDEIDHQSTMMIAVTYGFVLGRTFQEQETIRLAAAGKLMLDGARLP